MTSIAAEPHYSLEGKKIFIAGHRGMVGSAIIRQLEGLDVTVLTATRSTLDLRNQAEVFSWLGDEKPDAVVLAAAKVGGILANQTYPAEFLYENMIIQANVIHGAYQAGVKRLLFLGSSCIYPKFAPQPIPEDALLTGPLEPTNEWYAIAKIAGIKMCQAYRHQYGVDYISAMPTNLYGPNDNFDLEKSHVIPALIYKAHQAKLAGSKELKIWGSGKPLREFLHADDAANAMIWLLQHYSEDQHINVGSQEDISILDLAKLVAKTVGFEGKILNDHTKPDGTPRKLMDVSELIATGWTPHYSIEDGLAHTYQWFLDNIETARI